MPLNTSTDANCMFSLDSSLAISHDLLLGCDSKALKKTACAKAFQLLEKLSSHSLFLHSSFRL